MSEPMRNLRLFDTHAHINDEHFNGDRDLIISKHDLGVPELLVEVGTTLADSLKAVALANKYPGIYSAVGIHPYEINGLPDDYLDSLKELAKEDRVIAVGEIGLDYYRDLSPKSMQKRCLVEQLELAIGLGLPVILHVRDAYNDILEIVSEFSGKCSAVVHAYGGNMEEAKAFLRLGFKLGIGGTLTFKKNNDLREIVQKLPLESFLTETDCPYLTPVPFRGKRNEPSYVRYVVETISREKGFDIYDCSERLFENPTAFFGLNDKGGSLYE